MQIDVEHAGWNKHSSRSVSCKCNTGWEVISWSISLTHHVSHNVIYWIRYVVYMIYWAVFYCIGCFLQVYIKTYSHIHHTWARCIMFVRSITKGYITYTPRCGLNCMNLQANLFLKRSQIHELLSLLSNAQLYIYN